MLVRGGRTCAEIDISDNKHTIPILDIKIWLHA